MLERSGVARAGALRVKGTNGTNGTFLAFREVAHLTVTATGVGRLLQPADAPLFVAA
jgi:hypothetical protein